mgnify:CR=1 FL=1
MKRKLILLFSIFFTFCALIFFFVRDEVQHVIIEQQLETRSDAENAGLTCIQKLEKKGVEFVMYKCSATHEGLKSCTVSIHFKNFLNIVQINASILNKKTPIHQPF